jgi:hypothetical protein
MPKVQDAIPSRSFSLTLVGEGLETLNEIVSESRRLKPEWHDTPQSVINSIVEDFLSQHDFFDQFVLTRVDSQQRTLLRKIAELKGLRKAVREGTFDEPEESGGAEPRPPVEPMKTPSTPPPLGSASPAVR